MKNGLAVLLLASSLVSSLALANSCPKEMKAIDAKLNSTTNISTENLKKVKELREEGERLHKEGKHDESMKSLQEAKKILGI